MDLPLLIGAAVRDVMPHRKTLDGVGNFGLLLFVIPKEAQFGATKQAGNHVPHQRPANHEAQQADHDEKSGVGVWRRRAGRAYYYEADQESEEGESTADIRALPTCSSADNFRTTTNAHIGTFGDLRIAVRADQLLHPESIPGPAHDRERIPQNLVARRHPNTRHETRLAAHSCLIALRHGADPFHREFLQPMEKLTEVAPKKFDFMAGECKADRIGAISVGQ